MSVINFPSSPTDGQVFTDGDKTWVFSAISAGGPGAWKLQSTVVTGPTGPTGATGPGAQVATFADQKTSGTNGGTFTSGAWQTRTLNTTVYNGITSASLSSNQISLPAGTYNVIAFAPVGDTVQNHQARLQNITDTATTLTGTSMAALDISSAVPINQSVVMGVFTIAGTKTFELQHQCTLTKTTDGFGLAAGFGTEVYAQITITKIG